MPLWVPNNRNNILIVSEIIFWSKYRRWIRKVQYFPPCGEEYTSPTGRGWCGRNGGHLASHVHMLCSMWSFTPQPAECSWGVYSKELPLLVLHPPFVHLLLLIPHLAFRSCRAGQGATRTDGGLVPALVQWADPTYPLAERSLDLMYFLCLHVCQSCRNLWLHLRDLTDEVPCNTVPPQAATQLGWLLTKCFEDTWSNRHTTKHCQYKT